jgi:hypothetical protein
MAAAHERVGIAKDARCILPGAAANSLWQFLGPANEDRKRQRGFLHACGPPSRVQDLKVVKIHTWPRISRAMGVYDS